MSRRITPDRLEELQKLCSLRNSVALSSLAVAQKELRAVVEEIEKLENTNFTVTDPTAIRAAETWLDWKSAHLKNLNFHQAEKMATCQIQSELAARTSAELRVIEKLLQRALKDKRLRVERGFHQTS